jgi:hypothetical protein
MALARYGGVDPDKIPDRIRQSLLVQVEWPVSSLLVQPGLRLGEQPSLVESIAEAQE